MALLKPEPLPWHLREERLTKVLSDFFPSVNSSQISDSARNIGDGYSASLSLENIERSDKNPSADKKKLEAAANALDRAIAHLRDVGWHGGKALVSAAQKDKDGEEASVARSPRLNTHAGDHFARRLEEYSRQLKEAVRLTPDTAPYLISGAPREIEGKKQQTKPPSTAAKFTARECATVFFVLTNKRPTVPKKDGKAYGDFLSLVSKVFDALDLSASPETWANEAKTWFREVYGENSARLSR